MTDIKFTTLTDWNTFMKGRSVLILKEGHKFFHKECKFVKMEGAHEVLQHPSNLNGKRIKMRVMTPGGTTISLSASEFMIIEKKIVQQPQHN